MHLPPAPDTALLDMNCPTNIERFTAFFHTTWIIPIFIIPGLLTECIDETNVYRKRTYVRPVMA